MAPRILRSAGRSGRWVARAALALALCGPALALAGVPVARVDGVVIEQHRLDRAVAAHATAQGRNVAGVQSPAAWRRLVREALDRLVDEELLAQEAMRRGHGPRPDEVTQAVLQARAGLHGPAAFEILLEREGLTEAGFAARVGRQLAVERLVARELASDPDALRGRLVSLRRSARVEILLPLGGEP